MLARRFYKNTQSRSWNLIGTPASMYVTHDRTYRQSHVAPVDVAYKSYVDYCTRIGSSIQSFSDWCRMTDKMYVPGALSVGMSTPEDVAMHAAFHKYDPVVGDRRELQDQLTARQRGLPTDEYGNGSRRLRPMPRS